LTDLLGVRPSDLGAAALVAIVVLLVLLGRLVPRSVLEDVRTDRDTRLAELAQERDTWREAHAVSEEARREAQDQSAELLELSKVAAHFFSALPRAGEVKADAQDDQGSTAWPP